MAAFVRVGRGASQAFAFLALDVFGLFAGFPALACVVIGKRLFLAVWNDADAGQRDGPV